MSRLSTEFAQTSIVVCVIAIIISGTLNPILEGIFRIVVLLSCSLLLLVLPRILVPEKNGDTLSGRKYILQTLSLFGVSFAVLASVIAFGIKDIGSGTTLLPKFSIPTAFSIFLLLWLSITFSTLGFITQKAKTIPILVAAGLVPLGGIIIGNYACLYFVVGDGRPFLNEMVVLHAIILTVVGIVITMLMLAILAIKQKHLSKLSSDPVLLIGLPGAIGLVDLITIVQGFTGVAGHYKYLIYIAFTGILLSLLGFVSVLCFAIVSMRSGIPRRRLAHYLLGIGISLTFGCIMMYAMAEAGGFWYSKIHKQQSSQRSDSAPKAPLSQEGTHVEQVGGN